LIESGVLRVPSSEEYVLGGSEPCPQRIVDLARGARGTLPLGHEVLVLLGHGAEIGRCRQRLRLGDDLLLDPLALGVELVEFGEERLALVLEGRPCLREAAPQLLIDRARQARTVALHILPLCEQLTQTRARLLPLELRRILLGQSLGLGDELPTVLGRGEL